MCPLMGLNAPYGAWCFLTRGGRVWEGARVGVLMRLMALAAF